VSADYRTEHFRAWVHDGYLAVEEYRWDDWSESMQTGRSFNLSVEDLRELQSLVDQWQSSP
jgi:hypothetical protein